MSTSDGADDGGCGAQLYVYEREQPAIEDVIPLEEPGTARSEPLQDHAAPTMEERNVQPGAAP